MTTTTADKLQKVLDSLQSLEGASEAGLDWEYGVLREAIAAQASAAPEQEAVTVESPLAKMVKQAFDERDNEIERLRTELTAERLRADAAVGDANEAEQKLAEAQALLQRTYDADQAARHEKPYNVSALMDDIEAFLSATAQPAEVKS